MWTYNQWFPSIINLDHLSLKTLSCSLMFQSTFCLCLQCMIEPDRPSEDGVKCKLTSLDSLDWTLTRYISLSNTAQTMKPLV